MQRSDFARCPILSLLSLAFATATTGDVHAQTAQLVTDAVAKPAGIHVVPRGVPRSIGHEELFGAHNRVVTPALPVDVLLAEDAARQGPGPRRMGVVQEFDALSSAGDRWVELPDGGHLWTASFRATGAEAIRLRLAPWNPPAGAELILYSPGDPQSVRGPITRSYLPNLRTLWTPTVFSDEVRLEYYLPADVDHLGPAPHIGVDALLNQYLAHGDGPEGGGPLSCHLDVSCYPQWQLIANAVGEMSYVFNKYGFFCTGAMINRIGSDFTPLFVTATHCGVTAANVDGLLVMWFYQTDSCDGDVPPLDTLPQTPGVALLAADAITDFTLVGLSSADTGGVTWAGWNSGYMTDDSPATGIHHPAGSFKRISFGDKLNDSGTRPGPPGSTNCISHDAYRVRWPEGGGLTEPGSSGSPLLDSTGRVRGILSCSSWHCDSSNWSSYGRLDDAYFILQPYLDPPDPVYADAGYGGSERGTSAQPFNTIVEAMFCVLEGSNVYLQAGNYSETLIIDKAMTLNALNGVVVIGN